MMIVFIVVYLEPLLWCLTRSIGAGIVKYTEKNAPVHQKHFFCGQTPNSNNIVLFKLEFFYDTLYCCVRYSNIDCQDENSKLIIKVLLKR